MNTSKFFSLLISFCLLAGSFFTSISAPLTGSPKIAYADGWSLAGSDAFSGTVSVAMPITDLQVTGGSTTTVPVKLRVTSGSLMMTATSGLAFTGSSVGSTLYFSGTRDAVNSALATLQYTRGSTGTDTLEVSLVNSGEVFFTDNNHLYEYVSYTGDWNAAKLQAEARTKYGATGYLTTIASSTENDFVALRLLNAGWMGASDSGSEGVWRWVTGPENGTQFWSGASGGGTVGGNYANWGSGEPNDAGGNEDCAQFLTGGSGKWNDLPCSGTTLPGYVVEYGAPGNLPTVTAKNIAITTTALPTANSFSPADNSTNIGTSTNLVITFSQAVTPGAGSIALWNQTEQIVAEPILASSTSVTGSGTNTITIDPVFDLEENTDYYVIVDSNAFKNASDAYFAGISATTTWNFRTGDFTAPIQSSILATSTSSTTLTFTWTTNEAGSSYVTYDPNPNQIREISSIIDTSPRVTEHTVTVTDLVPCTWYRYRVHSQDAAGNTATSSFASAYTTGCTGGTAIKNLSSTNINASDTGTASAGNLSNLTVDTPAHFADASSTIAIQIAVLDTQTVLDEISLPDGKRSIGADIFDVKALLNGTDVVENFSAPVTLTFQYSDEDISGIDETSLRLYHYHGGVWSMLNNCSMNTFSNTVVCTTDNFSIFGLFGNALAPANTSGSRSAFEYGCRDSKAKNYNGLVTHRQSLCIYDTTNSSNQSSQTGQSTVISSSAWSQFTFTKNLYTGVRDKEVEQLQKFLNTSGFFVVDKGPGSSGQETTLFGGLTRAALVKFQKAHGITPAIGYFGPVTRGVIHDLKSKVSVGDR